MSKIITLTPEQVKAHPLIRKKGNKDIPILFYDFLAEHEHIPDNTMIQCTHVNIAKNIQDAWYNYVQEQKLMSEYEFTNVLLWKGPKAVDYLDDNTVKLKDDWYIMKDNNNRFRPIVPNFIANS